MVALIGGTGRISENEVLKNREYYFFYEFVKKTHAPVREISPQSE